MRKKDYITKKSFANTEIFFYKDVRKGKRYISLKEISDYFKLNWQEQRNSLLKDKRLSKYCISVLMHDDSLNLSNHLFIEISAISIWLDRISAI